MNIYCFLTQVLLKNEKAHFYTQAYETDTPFNFISAAS